MPKHSPIYLFSKTGYPDVNHIPILVPAYIQVPIDFSSFDYIIATSKEVLIALDKIGDWTSLPVLAISESTADFARTKGARILDVADGYGQSIASIVAQKYADLKALYPHAKVMAFDLDEKLSKQNISITSVTVYETSCSKDKKIELPSDAICIFTSPSSIKCFEKKYDFLPTYKIVCIGETTASALPNSIKCVLSEKTSIQSTIERAQSLI